MDISRARYRQTTSALAITNDAHRYKSRKPEPGLVLQSAEDDGIDNKRLCDRRPLAGRRSAHRAHCKTVFIGKMDLLNRVLKRCSF
jgi:hypothetical protein